MIEEGKIRFRTFTLDIKRRPIPNSYLLSFSGGSEIDSSGWETPTGDRKKLEGDFKFLWNPLDAPSNKKGEFVVRFSTEDGLHKFQIWLDNQVRQYGGLFDK